MIKNLQCLLEDHTGQIWCGTDNGLFYWQDSAFVREDDFPADNIHCLLASEQSTKPLCGTSIGLLQWNNGSWQAVEKLAGQDVRCLLQQRDDLWCGTNRGLVRGTAGAWRTIEATIDLPINALRQEPGQELLLWCGSEAGLASFDGHRYESIYLDINVTCLLLDSEDDLWCGTSGGLLRRPSSGGHWEKTAIKERIQALLADRAGDVLCGTEAGLYRSKGASWQKLEEPELAEGVQCLLEDRTGQIWCGRIKGYTRLQARLPQAPAPTIEAAPAPAATPTVPASSTPTPAKELVPGPTPAARQKTVISKTSSSNTSERSSVLPPNAPEMSVPATRPLPWYARRTHWQLALPTADTLNWLVTAVALVVVVTVAWWPQQPLSQSLPALQQQALSSRRPARPPANRLSTAQAIDRTIETFYRTINREGHLDEAVSTARLRDNIGNRSEILLYQGNFERIEPGRIIRPAAAGRREVHLQLRLHNRTSLEAVLDVVAVAAGWQVDRVRYLTQRSWQCLGGRRATYVFSDTDIFRGGWPVARLSNPCVSPRPIKY
ncbi:hypothetical protein [Gloeobacter kilaueensis]|uniref:Histidine kinase n=1 Tax=Gloeobacter kilaueensis (strain ATCC BAA-2537 / CCAP 1431/1 / ULC 316 / JS1) TaxID=1183438 RepID=U5QFL0_GLOK1|nr:hypothetical protein [Gloeobacter kilaueensis]AGY56460.1 histidine kinase [Gloeobacter kilaueensis JS1]